MNPEVQDLLDELKGKMEAKNVYVLRQVGRAVGVKSSTRALKEPLITAIMGIASGEKDPCKPSRRGAPPKSNDYDAYLVGLVNKCREFSLKGDGAVLQDIRRMTVAGQSAEPDEIIATGIFDASDKVSYVRTDNLQPNPAKDVFVTVPTALKLGLQSGDKVICKAKKREKGETGYVLTELVGLNGAGPDEVRGKPLPDRVAHYPNRKIVLSHGMCGPSERLIDLYSPIGFGTRGLIVSPSRCGKTTLIQKIATSVRANYPEALVIVLLIDSRPEEVTEIKKNTPKVEVFCSTFESGARYQVKAASLVLDYASRQAEAGRDVVLLLDDLTSLTRANNTLFDPSNRVSGYLNADAVRDTKRFFASARATEEKGSLTFLAAVKTETGDELDTVIYNEFKNAANTEIILRHKDVNDSYFPVVDTANSSTRKEELLLTAEEFEIRNKVTQACRNGESESEAVINLLAH